MGVKTATIHDWSNFLIRQAGIRSNEQVNIKSDNDRNSPVTRIDSRSTQREYFTKKLERRFKVVGKGTCPCKE